MYLSLLPDDSLHLDILWEDVAHARGQLCADWATGIDMQFATLGMASQRLLTHSKATTGRLQGVECIRAD